VVRKALEQGHAVTVLARHPARLALPEIEAHPDWKACLHVIQGDVRDAETVAQAVAGAEAVISALAPDPKAGKDILTLGAGNIVAAMQAYGVRRLIFTTGAGVSDPNDRPKLFNRLMSALLKRLAADVLADSIGGVEQVRRSRLDWTLVRLPMLTDAPGTGRVRSGYVGIDTGPRISRADVADFLLAQIEDRRFVGKAPVISN
jgi:putative NADH-flavin reductase